MQTLLAPCTPFLVTPGALRQLTPRALYVVLSCSSKTGHEEEDTSKQRCVIVFKTAYLLTGTFTSITKHVLLLGGK